MIVTIHAEDGSVEGHCDFTSMPGSLELRRAFAAALDRKSGPGGTWRSYEGCRQGFRAIRHFSTWLSGLDDPPETAAEITPAMVRRWRMSLPDVNHQTLLRNLMAEVPGLPSDTRKASEYRIPRDRRPLEQASFSYAELEAIRSRAALVFNTALTRIRSNRDHLERWYAGGYTEGGMDWQLGEALDCLVRTGDVPRINTVGRHVEFRYRPALGGEGHEATWARLYLTRNEAAAAAVLLVASESWNRSVLARMRVPDQDPAVADDVDIHTMEIHKRRRPVRLRYTTNNLLDAGPGTPGRLMGQVIEATETARQTLALLGVPTDKLLIWRRATPIQGPSGRFGVGPPKNTAPLAERADDDLSAVSLRQLRRTVQVLIRKEPAQNSQKTHEDVYVLGDPAARTEAQDIVAEGLTNAVDHARIVVKMRMVLDETTDRLVELSEDPELAKAIDSGELDTATGACTDFTNSPYTESGLPCTASFLLCLGCENAVATRRHLPRLIHLHQALEELRSALDPLTWEQDWREHLLRVASLLKNHTTAEERAEAQQQISSADRELIDRMLRRKLDS